MSIDISAIVCTYNRPQHLRKAIESLLKQSYPKERCEILVVDNASAPETESIVAEYSGWSHVRYLREPTLGLSHARNLGWRAARGKYVAFMDDDAIASSRWLERIVKAFDTISPKPGSVGGRVIPIWGAARPNWLPKDLERSLTVVDWSNKPRFLSPTTEYLAGTNVAYPRQLLRDCGGFSTELGRKGRNLLSSEEILIRNQMKQRDLGSYYDPEICVQHYIPPERLKKGWFYRRTFWQGISTEILQYLAREGEDRRTGYCRRAFGNILKLLRRRRSLFTIFGRADSCEKVMRKCAVYWSCGQIRGQLQIGLDQCRARMSRALRMIAGKGNSAVLRTLALFVRPFRVFRDSGAKASQCFSIVRVCLTDPPGFRIIESVTTKRLSYLEPSALLELYEGIAHVRKACVKGSVIEAGCALGGSALVLAAAKETWRPLYVYDVFTTIPPPSTEDGEDAHARYETIASGLSKGIAGQEYYGYQKKLREKVADTFEEHGFRLDHHNVHLIEGLYQDTLHPRGLVALAHLDCDWYESVMTCLQRIVPHLARNGMLIIDDYFTWSGCRAAVDDYFSDKKAHFKFSARSRLQIMRK